MDTETDAELIAYLNRLHQKMAMFRGAFIDQAVTADVMIEELIALMLAPDPGLRQMLQGEVIQRQEITFGVKIDIFSNLLGRRFPISATRTCCAASPDAKAAEQAGASPPRHDRGVLAASVSGPTPAGVVRRGEEKAGVAQRR
ncbi:MAG: hypothetical protein KIT14_12165 [bacterium]|nr:hypothetical protein [bacterium]